MSAFHPLRTLDCRGKLLRWRDRIGLGAVEGTADLVDGQRRTTWRDTAGRAVIEDALRAAGLMR